MGLLQRMSEEAGTSVEGVVNTTGILRIQKQFQAPRASTNNNGDSEAQILASTTTYNVLGIMPKAGKLVGGYIRVDAAGNGTTPSFDLYYVSSGISAISGISMVTQQSLASASISLYTNTKLTINTSGYANVGQGHAIVGKVFAASGSLTPSAPFVDLTFRL